jgi:WD40 repeat protein
MEGHTSIVAAVALSADERRAFSGSYDHTARIWELDGGRCIRVLRGHRRQVTAVCEAGAGWACASGDYEGAIFLWSSDGSATRLAGHLARVTGLRPIGDASRLLSASCDGTLRLWDLGARSCARVLEGHGAAVLGLDCSADGRWAVSAAADGSVRLWDLDGEQSHVLAEGAGGGGAFLAEEDCAVLIADERGLSAIEIEWELAADEGRGPRTED